MYKKGEREKKLWTDGAKDKMKDVEIQWKGEKKMVNKRSVEGQGTSKQETYIHGVGRHKKLE